MITRRHNTPQHNPHAGRPGNAGDCASDGRSRVFWKQLGIFFAAVVLAGFVLNEIWEMAQMSAYVETADRSWTETLGLCTRAAIGDVGIILAIYAAGALAAADPGWGLRVRWNVYATTSLLGLIYGALVEQMALATGRWSYSERMPVVATIGAGLWPLLQMTLLPPLTIWIGQSWAGRCVTKNSKSKIP